MAKIKDINQASRSTVLMVMGAIIALSIGLAAVTHADTVRGTGVFIGANGNARVHGATVTATSTSGLTATTNLGGNTITWDVNASSTTRFGLPGQGKLGEGLSALVNIAIGDIVSFWGKFSGSGSTLTVDAVAIKDHTKATTTPGKIGKDRGERGERSERPSLRGIFNHFLNAHDKLKARFEARFGVGDDD